MALPLPRAASLLLLLILAAPLLCYADAEGPISPASLHLRPESTPDDGEPDSSSPSLAPAQSPANDEDKAASTPAPTKTAPAPAEAPAPAPSSSPHSAAATPTPAPSPSGDNDNDDDDDPYKKENEKSPAPSPAAMEVKSCTGSGADEQQPQAVDGAASEAERRDEGMSGGKKAGVVVGAFSAAAVVGLAAVVYRKRQANIRRSRYADYSARVELV